MHDSKRSNKHQLVSDGTVHKTTGKNRDRDRSVMQYTFYTIISDVTVTFSRGTTNKQANKKAVLRSTV